MPYAASPAYAQTGFFRALVAEVVRRWPGMDTQDLVETLSLDQRRLNYMALQEGGPFEARQFADRVLGITAPMVPNVGAEAPEPALVGQNRHQYDVFRRALDGIPPWSEQDMHQAMSEGWIVSSVDDGTSEVQKFDEDPDQRFDTDAEAQKFVERQASSSIDLDCIHNRALRYVAHSHGNL